MTEKPYVHTYAELLDDLPAFSNGSKLNILVCIGLSQARGNSPDFSDIVRITRLSVPTVTKYIEQLVGDGMIAEEYGRYRTLKYFSFNKKFSSVVSTLNKEKVHTTLVGEFNCTSTNYEQKLFENFSATGKAKRTPQKKERFEPRTPVAVYLSKQCFYGKPYIRWAGFETSAERERWEQIERDYEAETIKSKIKWGLTSLKPSNVIGGIITALTKHVKPDKKAEPQYVDNSVSSDIAIEIPQPNFGHDHA